MSDLKKTTLSDIRKIRESSDFEMEVLIKRDRLTPNFFIFWSLPGNSGLVYRERGDLADYKTIDAACSAARKVGVEHVTVVL